MNVYKVLLLGKGGVGKNDLVVSFMSSFIDNYDPNNDDCFRREIIIDGSPTVLEILDTSGTEEYSAMRDMYINNNQGFLLIYCITDQRSFDDVKNLKGQIFRVKETQNVPIVLVGNNCYLEEQRAVPTSEGQALATSWSCPFFETCIKSRKNIENMFVEIVQEIIKHTNPNKENNSDCCILL